MGKLLDMCRELSYKLLVMCSELSYKLLYNKFSFTTQTLPLIKM